MKKMYGIKIFKLNLRSLEMNVHKDAAIMKPFTLSVYLIDAISQIGKLD